VDSVTLIAARSLEKPAITDVLHYLMYARTPEFMGAD
jgi:hypothetical protein